MSRSTPQRRPDPVSDKRYVMTFGKYRGDTVQDILDNDPNYLVWCHENTDFELSHDLLELAENQGKPSHMFKGYTARDFD